MCDLLFLCPKSTTFAFMIWPSSCKHPVAVHVNLDMSRFTWTAIGFLQLDGRPATDQQRVVLWTRCEIIEVTVL